MRHKKIKCFHKCLWMREFVCVCERVCVCVYIYICGLWFYAILSLLQFSLVKSFKYLLQDKNYYSIYMLYVYITILNILLLLYGLLCVYLCCCCCCHFNQYLLLMFLLSLRSSLGIKTRCYIDWFLFRFDFALISLCVFCFSDCISIFMWSTCEN